MDPLFVTSTATSLTTIHEPGPDNVLHLVAITLAFIIRIISFAIEQSRYNTANTALYTNRTNTEYTA